MHKEIRFYRNKSGMEPFIEWFNKLRDKKLRAQIKNRMERVSLGNYGDYKSIGNGIYELRIHYGEGYRIYFAEHDKRIIIFLTAGNKHDQEKDIQKAKIYWSEFKETIYV